MSKTDKPSWPPGPWDDEPKNGDHWIDEATGYFCLILRHTLGNLCGYVGVPPTHPWFGRNYNGKIGPVGPTKEEMYIMGHNLENMQQMQKLGLDPVIDGDHISSPDRCSMPYEETPEALLDVHGGVTFSGDGNKVINHPDAGVLGAWYFGFDCAHCDDLIPGMSSMKFGKFRELEKLFRDIQGMLKEHPGSWRREEDVYRDMDYVRKEVDSLAKQLFLFDLSRQIIGTDDGTKK